MDSTDAPTMRLYAAVSAGYARRIVTEGFAGRSVELMDEAAENWTGEILDYCEFRDMPPAGLTFSRTTEAEVEATETGVNVVLSGGPVLADDIGDFIVSIEVPGDLVREYRVTETSGAGEPVSWPFQEYWLPPDVANKHRDTLEVFVSEMPEDGPIGLDAFERDHGLFVTERLSTAFLGEDPGGTFLASAICVCGERWNFRTCREDENPRPVFDAWAADHV